MKKYTIEKMCTDGTWLDVKLTKYKIKKPIVLFLSGNGTIEREQAHRSADFVKNLIGLNDEADVICVSYSHDENAKIGTLFKEDIDEILPIFYPLFLKNGKRLPFEQAKKNFRLVNVETYCHGADVLSRINNQLLSCFVEHGYTMSEGLELLQQIFNLSYAPCINDPRNKHFSVKSLDDDKYGKFYANEIKDLDLSKIYPNYLKRNRLSEKYLFDISRKITESDVSFLGCGFMRKSGTGINLYVQELSPLGANDHYLSNVRRQANYQMDNKHQSTLHGDITSQCMSHTLAFAIINSIQNCEGAEFIPLDMDKIYALCHELLVSGNNSEEEKEKYRNFVEKHAVYSINEVMQENGVSESDILTGKSSLFALQMKLKKAIDYSDTIFEKMIKLEAFAMPGYQFPNQPKPSRTYPITEQFGIIWDNGDVSFCTDLTQALYTTLHRIVFKNCSIKNAVLFELKNDGEAGSIKLFDNFGSKDNSFMGTFTEVIKDWKDNYKRDKLTFKLNQSQKYALESIKNKFGIDVDLTDTSTNEFTSAI